MSIVDGTGVISGKDDAQFTVTHSRDGSTRVTSILTSKVAPEVFSYTFSGVGSLTLNGNGSVTIDNGHGQTIGLADTPWALDASGVRVPTHYEIDGNTLTQIIEHHSGNFIYPLSADPAWWDWAAKATRSLGQKAGWLAGKAWSGMKWG